MFEVQFKNTLQAIGPICLGLVCMISVETRAVAVEPPRLISPEAFTNAVPPPPPPAPAESEEKPPRTEAVPAPEQPELPLPESYDPNDPAMQPVDLHLTPLSDWNNLNQQSSRLTVDPRYIDGRPIEPNQPPKDILYRAYHTDTPESLELVGGGGMENPFFAPVSPFCYKPLYFEEGCLERHGQSAGPLFQPVFSGIEFYTRIGLLPVKMLFEKPNREYLTIWPEPVDPAYEYGF
jgi:hypothetical protein